MDNKEVQKKLNQQEKDVDTTNLQTQENNTEQQINNDQYNNSNKKVQKKQEEIDYNSLSKNISSTPINLNYGDKQLNINPQAFYKMLLAKNKRLFTRKTDLKNANEQALLYANQLANGEPIDLMYGDGLKNIFGRYRGKSELDVLDKSVKSFFDQLYENSPNTNYYNKPTTNNVTNKQQEEKSKFNLSSILQSKYYGDSKDNFISALSTPIYNSDERLQHIKDIVASTREEKGLETIDLTNMTREDVLKNAVSLGINLNQLNKYLGEIEEAEDSETNESSSQQSAIADPNAININGNSITQGDKSFSLNPGYTIDPITNDIKNSGYILAKDSNGGYVLYKSSGDSLTEVPFDASTGIIINGKELRLNTTGDLQYSDMKSSADILSNSFYFLKNQGTLPAIDNLLKDRENKQFADITSMVLSGDKNDEYSNGNKLFLIRSESKFDDNGNFKNTKAWKYNKDTNNFSEVLLSEKNGNVFITENGSTEQRIKQLFQNYYFNGDTKIFTDEYKSQLGKLFLGKGLDMKTLNRGSSLFIKQDNNDGFITDKGIEEIQTKTGDWEVLIDNLIKSANNADITKNKGQKSIIAVISDLNKIGFDKAFQASGMTKEEWLDFENMLKKKVYNEQFSSQIQSNQQGGRLTQKEQLALLNKKTDDQVKQAQQDEQIKSIKAKELKNVGRIGAAGATENNDFNIHDTMNIAEAGLDMVSIIGGPTAAIAGTLSTIIGVANDFTDDDVSSGQAWANLITNTGLTILSIVPGLGMLKTTKQVAKASRILDTTSSVFSSARNALKASKNVTDGAKGLNKFKKAEQLISKIDTADSQLRAFNKAIKQDKSLLVNSFQNIANNKVVKKTSSILSTGILGLGAYNGVTASINIVNDLSDGKGVNTEDIKSITGLAFAGKSLTQLTGNRLAKMGTKSIQDQDKLLMDRINKEFKTELDGLMKNVEVKFKSEFNIKHPMTKNERTIMLDLDRVELSKNKPENYVLNQISKKHKSLQNEYDSKIIKDGDKVTPIEGVERSEVEQLVSEMESLKQLKDDLTNHKIKISNEKDLLNLSSVTGNKDLDDLMNVYKQDNVDARVLKTKQDYAKEGKRYGILQKMSTNAAQRRGFQSERTFERLVNIKKQQDLQIADKLRLEEKAKRQKQLLNLEQKRNKRQQERIESLNSNNNNMQLLRKNQEKFNFNLFKNKNENNLNNNLQEIKNNQQFQQKNISSNKYNNKKKGSQQKIIYSGNHVIKHYIGGSIINKLQAVNYKSMLRKYDEGGSVSRQEMGDRALKDIDDNTFNTNRYSALTSAIKNDKITLDNYKNHNDLFNRYYTLNKNAKYNGKRAVKLGEPVSTYQTDFNNMGVIPQSVYTSFQKNYEGPGFKPVGDREVDGKYVSDGIYGGQTNEYKYNVFNDAELVDINNLLKGRGLEFVFDERSTDVVGPEGKKYYKLQPFEQKEDATEEVAPVVDTTKGIVEESKESTPQVEMPYNVNVNTGQAKYKKINIPTKQLTDMISYGNATSANNAATATRMADPLLATSKEMYTKDVDDRAYTESALNQQAQNNSMANRFQSSNQANNQAMALEIADRNSDINDKIAQQNTTQLNNSQQQVQNVQNANRVENNRVADMNRQAIYQNNIRNKDLQANNILANNVSKQDYLEKAFKNIYDLEQQEHMERNYNEKIDNYSDFMDNRNKTVNRYQQEMDSKNNPFMTKFEEINKNVDPLDEPIKITDINPETGNTWKDDIQNYTKNIENKYSNLLQKMDSDYNRNSSKVNYYKGQGVTEFKY